MGLIIYALVIFLILCIIFLSKKYTPPVNNNPSPDLNPPLNCNPLPLPLPVQKNLDLSGSWIGRTYEPGSDAIPAIKLSLTQLFPSNSMNFFIGNVNNPTPDSGSLTVIKRDPHFYALGFLTSNISNTVPDLQILSTDFESIILLMGQHVFVFKRELTF
jgi:hypothetical protein